MARSPDAGNCGWDTGTVYTGPRICGKPAKYTATERGGRLVVPTTNGKACGVHARSARGHGFVVEPITEENP